MAIIKNAGKALRTVGKATLRAGGVLKKGLNAARNYSGVALKTFDLARPFLDLIPGSQKALGAVDAVRDNIGLMGGEKYYSPAQLDRKQFNDGRGSLQQATDDVSDNADGENSLTTVSNAVVQFTPEEARRSRTQGFLPDGPSINPQPSAYFVSAGTNIGQLGLRNGYNDGQNDYAPRAQFYSGAIGERRANGIRSLAVGAIADLSNPSLDVARRVSNFEYGDTPDLWSNYFSDYGY